MASRFYGLSRGEPGQTFVTEAASTTSKNLEIVVNRASGWTKKDLKIALDRIYEYITTSPTNNLVE